MDNTKYSFILNNKDSKVFWIIFFAKLSVLIKVEKCLFVENVNMKIIRTLQLPNEIEGDLECIYIKWSVAVMQKKRGYTW